jgi:hypothetical protein
VVRREPSTKLHSNAAAIIIFFHFDLLVTDLPSLWGLVICVFDMGAKVGEWCGWGIRAEPWNGLDRLAMLKSSIGDYRNLKSVENERQRGGRSFNQVGQHLPWVVALHGGRITQADRVLGIGKNTMTAFWQPFPKSLAI